MEKNIEEKCYICGIDNFEFETKFFFHFYAKFLLLLGGRAGFGTYISSIMSIITSTFLFTWKKNARMIIPQSNIMQINLNMTAKLFLFNKHLVFPIMLSSKNLVEKVNNIFNLHQSFSNI